MALTAQELVQLYKYPNHWGQLDSPTHQATIKNPACGDSLTVHIIVDESRITDIGFSGEGCSVSIATASLLGDAVVEQSVDEVITLTADDAVALTGVPAHRRGCALLPWAATMQALGDERPWDVLTGQ